MHRLQVVAGSMGVVSSPWNVWSSFLPTGVKLAIQQTVADFASWRLAYVAKSAIAHFLKTLDFSAPYSLHLGPLDWKLPNVMDIFNIKVSDQTRERIAESVGQLVENVIREGARSGALWSDQPLEISNLIIEKALDELPEFLAEGEWRSIVTKAVQEIFPKMTGQVWVEAATFTGTLDYLAALNDPSVTNLTLWSFVAELENRPDILSIMRLNLVLFFTIQDNDDNTNGPWGWCGGVNSAIEEQLTPFEQHPTDYWKNYAFLSSKYDSWAKDGREPSDKGKNFPRIDYLMMLGLHNIGSPKSLEQIVTHWLEEFVSIAKRLLQKLLDDLGDSFRA